MSKSQDPRVKAINAVTDLNKYIESGKIQADTDESREALQKYQHISNYILHLLTMSEGSGNIEQTRSSSDSSPVTIKHPPTKLDDETAAQSEESKTKLLAKQIQEDVPKDSNSAHDHLQHKTDEINKQNMGSWDVVNISDIPGNAQEDGSTNLAPEQRREYQIDENEDLRKRNKGLDEQVSKLKEDLQRQQKNKTELESKVNTLESQLAEQKNGIEERDRRIAELETSSHATSEEHGNLKEQFNRLCNHLAEAENKWRTEKSNLEKEHQNLIQDYLRNNNQLCSEKDQLHKEYEEYKKSMQQDMKQMIDDKIDLKRQISDIDIEAQKSDGLKKLNLDLTKSLTDAENKWRKEKLEMENNHQQTVQSYQTANIQLCSEKEHLQKEKGKLEEMFSKVKNDRDELSKRLKEAENKWRNEKREMENDHQQTLQSYQMTNSQVVSEKEQLQKEKDELHEKFSKVKNDRDELSKRLSEEWSNKVSADESNIENVSIQNRPMNIATKYESICTTEWLDVKEVVDNVCSEASEEDKHHLLQQVILTSEAVGEQKYKDLMKTVSALISKPVERFRPHKAPTRSIATNIKTATIKTSESTQRQPHTDPKDRGEENLNPTEVVQQSSGGKENGNTTGDQMDVIEDSDKAVCSHEGTNVDNGYVDDKKQNPEAMECDESEKDDTTAKEFKKPEEEAEKTAPLEETSQTTDNNESTTAEEVYIENEIIEFEVSTETNEKISTGVKLPDQLYNTLGDYLRSTSDHLNLKEITQDIVRVLCNNPDFNFNLLLSKLKDNTCFEKYVSVCAALAWNMVIQRPKMEFGTSGIGVKWNINFQEPAYGGDNPDDPASVVQYYLHPTLMHANKVMVKGKVLTKIKRENWT